MRSTKKVRNAISTQQQPTTGRCEVRLPSPKSLGSVTRWNKGQHNEKGKRNWMAPRFEFCSVLNQRPGSRQQGAGIYYLFFICSCRWRLSAHWTCAVVQEMTAMAQGSQRVTMAVCVHTVKRVVSRACQAVAIPGNMQRGRGVN